LEMHQEAIKEATAEGRSISGVGVPYLLLSSKPISRASTGQNIATAGDGGYLKQESPLLFLAALRNKMVLSQLGAKFITGLVGDFPIVTGSLFTASWLAEDAVDTTQKIAFTKVTMQPKRVQATGALSLKLLKQSTPDVETLITDELVDSIAQALQIAAINGAGTDAPLGILGVTGIGDVPGGTDGLAPAWSHIVTLESKILAANADGPSMGYLTNAKARGKLKQVVKASNTAEFIWDKDGMNGYKALVTNAVPGTLTKGGSGAVCSAILFADWSKLFIGQWGGLDIIVDPYSLKKKAEIEITALSYYDICATYPAAFAAMKDALTT
jgi:HK97 family phage major capsid protein